MTFREQQSPTSPRIQCRIRANVDTYLASGTPEAGFGDAVVAAVDEAEQDAATTPWVTGVVHGDLHPANVVATRRGPVVVDFDLAGVEPSLTFVASATQSGGPKSVSVDAFSSTEWEAAVWSASGNCYYIQDMSNGPGTQFGGVTSGATQAV